MNRLTRVGRCVRPAVAEIGEGSVERGLYDAGLLLLNVFCYIVKQIKNIVVVIKQSS